MTEAPGIYTIAPIETYYRGYRMRSRLEARWGCYMDAVGIKWLYEPEGYHTKMGDYLPDFLLPDLNCFAEVKPDTFTQEQYDKCAQLPKPCILLDTSVPLVWRGYYVTAMDWSAYENYLSNGDWGRVILEISQRKNHLWFLLGESLQDYCLDITPEILAKSARFEYGERG